MTLDANPDTIRVIAEALKLASLLDDRVAAPDKARIYAWAKQAEPHNLSRDDILDGLQRFYDEPRERAIGIGDLLTQARAIRRDRAERTLDREPAQVDTEPDDLAAFTAAALGPRAGDTARLKDARKGLQTCHGRCESQAAVAEYLAALKEARRK